MYSVYRFGFMYYITYLIITFGAYVSGAIAFDSTGDAKRDVAYVKQVNNTTGKWNFIAVQKVK